MADADFWKRRYQQLWQSSSRKEALVARLIHELTGFCVREAGLGAGSTDFLSGSAESHGHDRGDADLEVLETNVWIEVTGPISKNVTADAPLWIRPDKIQNARAHMPSRKTVVVHQLALDGLLRVVSLNDYFYECLDRGEFATVRPKIRGTQETYISIDSSHRVVRPFDRLITYLESLRG